MDDVLVNLNEAWVSYLNRVYSLSVKNDDIVEWDMKKAFPGLTEEQLYSCLHSEEFWKTVNPTEFSKEILQKCEDNSSIIDYYIATAALPKNFYVKWKNCLKRYFPFVPSNRIICCNNKKLINCGIMVDDNPDNFPDSTIRILIDKSWNRNVNPYKYDYRAQTLEFVFMLINNIVNQERKM